MVKESLVLLRVQNLKERRSRVPLKRCTNFIDLIQHDDRVLDFDILQRLNEFAWHGANVSAPVPFDFASSRMPPRLKR